MRASRGPVRSSQRRALRACARRSEAIREWLPFEIESAGRPGVLIAAAGPTKADGSPNMSMGANIRVRNLLKSPEPMRALDGGEVGEAARPPSSPVAPDAPETEGVVIAAQLRAAAAAIAPMLAWIFVVMWPSHSFTRTS